MGENRPNLSHLSEEKQKKLGKFDWQFAGSAALGLCLAACYSCQSRGETVYDGQINGVSIIYREGRPAGFSEYGNLDQNSVVLKKGRQTFELYDFTDETSIGWKSNQKPNFEQDELDEIIITLGSGERRRFLALDIGSGTEEGKMAKEMFSVMNPFYNGLRAQIREIKRKETNLNP